MIKKFTNFLMIKDTYKYYITNIIFIDDKQMTFYFLHYTDRKEK